jgi:hypothetical protein
MAARLMWVLAAVALLAGAVLAAMPAPSEEAVEPPKEQVCIDTIDAFAGGLKVGRPRRHGALALFPVFAETAVEPGVDLTLDEALERELLEIRELKSPEVNRVVLVSKAKEPVFVMGGEMLGGAKQDRIIGDDLIVPSCAELVIPVYCVEQGRWVAKGEAFTSTRTLAASAVRKAADQSCVWQEVAESQERLNAPSQTGAMRSIKESEHVQSRVQPYVRALSDLPDDVPAARGVVAAVGGRVIAADLFGSRAVFEALWPKLLESYVIDALQRDASGVIPDAVEIRRWLHEVRRAERTPEDTPGAGDLYQLRGDRLLGSVLAYEYGVVHMELFRTYVVEPVEFNRLDFRRERLGVEQQEPQPER